MVGGQIQCLCILFDYFLFGLYRDDGLPIFKNISGPKSEKFEKVIQKLFKENELDIVIQRNMKAIKNLDGTLNLENSTYHSQKNNDNNNNNNDNKK